MMISLIKFLMEYSRQAHKNQYYVLNIVTQNLEEHANQEKRKIKNYEKSVFDKQDQHKMKEMIQKQKQYQEYLENQAQELEQKIRQQEEQELKALEDHKKQQCQLRKQEILDGIEMIKKRRQQRISRKNEENKKYLELKTKIKLYQKMQHKFHQTYVMQKKNQESEFKRMKETQKVNFDEIREHTAKHDQTMTKMRQSRINSSRISRSPIKKFYESTFMSRVVEEDINMKSRIFEKQNLAKEFAEKRSEYAQIVRENYKPKNFIKKSLQQIPEQVPIRSMSHKQMHLKGTEYMRQVNSSMPKKRSLKSLFSRSQHGNFKYPNYLDQMKTRRSEQIMKSIPQKLPTDNSKFTKQIDRIMKKQGLNKNQKFQEAKIVIKKLESTSYQKKDPFKLIDSINVKIDILKKLDS